MEIRSVAALPAGVHEPGATTPGPGGGFGQVIDRLLQTVQGPQAEADAAVRALAMGQTDQLHQVLLSVAKADLAFRMMLEVRNKLTEAWQEIQRMQV